MLGRVVRRHERGRGVVDERRVRDGFLDAVDEALHPALRPVLGRVATGHGEMLEVEAVGLHVVDDDAGRLAALLVGDLGEVRELVAVRLDAHGEDRDARGHDVVGDLREGVACRSTGSTGSRSGLPSTSASICAICSFESWTAEAGAIAVPFMRQDLLRLGERPLVASLVLRGEQRDRRRAVREDVVDRLALGQLVRDSRMEGERRAVLEGAGQRQALGRRRRASAGRRRRRRSGRRRWLTGCRCRAGSGEQ